MDQSFKDYMLKEYDQIANAHFNMVQNISTFFRHYLVIMAIPAALLSLSSKTGISDITNRIGENGFYLAVSAVFVILSIVGLCVCMYVMNLRFDAILYARTVNGIRKFFYNNSSLAEVEKSHIRVLPQITNIPRYNEKIFFYPVLICFALFNSGYLIVGSLLFENCNFDLSWVPSGVFEALNYLPKFYLGHRLWVSNALILILYAFIHWAFYVSGARTRESIYLNSRSIGVDIDGVLNRHREHFCDILKDNGGPDIDPDSILHIPVHEAGLGVSQEQELEVFNNPRYWSDMPVNLNVSSNIRKLMEELRFNVYVFSNRPWPTYANNLKNSNHKHKNLWGKKCIVSLTEVWLKQNNISYKKLFVETLGNKNNWKINRYAKSKDLNIKYFIEDEYEKAVSLSYLCDIVFLINHPYNSDRKDLPLPQNVVRVDSWDEIYKKLRMQN